MMKRNILAAAVTTMLAAGSVHAAEIYNKDGNKLDLYGKINGEHDFVTTGDSNSSDATYAQLGFKGETQINSFLTGYGQWEYRMLANKAESDQTNKTRLAFAGLKMSDYGSVDYGRNYGVIYDVESFTDMAPDWSGATWAGAYTDNFMTSRGPGMLTYRNTDFFGLADGLHFGVQYQGKNDNDNRLTTNGDGVGFSLGYDSESGLGIIGGYSKANRTTAQKEDGRGDSAEAWATGLKYDAHNVYLATVYAETRNMTRQNTAAAGFANRTQNFEAIAQYQFDFGLRPSVSYVQTKGKNLNGYGDFNGGSAWMAKFVEIGATYYFNKNFNVFADYLINLLDKGDSYTRSVGGLGVGNDDMLGVGVTYQF